MFEKIKDFLYDISDIFVSLLIIGVIFYAVSWKISDTLRADINEPLAPATEAIGTTEASIIVTPIDPEASTESGSEASTEVTTEAATEAPTQAATQAPTQAPQKLVLENFVVTEGELGYTIGKNLEAQGFVTSADNFVQRLIQMGYDSKLRSGTFKLDKKDSLDVIIKVLSGEKR